MHKRMYVHYVELSHSENFAITIVEIMMFTIMNTITIVDSLNISIHNTKIKHGFLCYEPSQFHVTI